ncbi:MAG: metallophosphoesterase, partial [Ignavibacteria bacterium]|nr:metallophosphoesterase [Ignavibacteria bacterium]
MEKYFFISDLHFGYNPYPQEKHLIKKFETLCENIIKESGELFVLGDLFDYWFEYKTAVQKNSHRIITQLENLIESGINIHYIIGN